jgi:hypothetical protein
VATQVTKALSWSSAKDCPARALRRKIRHPPSLSVSQAAPTGMKACRIRGWASNHSRMGPVL